MIYNEDNEPAYFYSIDSKSRTKDPNVIGFEAIDESSFYLRHYEFDWEENSGQLISEVIVVETTDGFEVVETEMKSGAKTVSLNGLGRKTGVKSRKSIEDDPFDGMMRAVSMTRNFINGDLKSSIKDFLDKGEKTLDYLPLPPLVKSSFKFFIGTYSKLIDNAFDSVDMLMFDDEQSYRMETGYKSLIDKYGSFFENANETVSQWVEDISGGASRIICTYNEIHQEVGISLDGYWTTGGTTIYISGSSGIFYTLSGMWQEFADYGKVKIGDQKLRNIVKTDDLKWTCQELWWVTTDGVPSYVTWSDAGSIEMSEDGGSFLISSSIVLNGELQSGSYMLYRTSVKSSPALMISGPEAGLYKTIASSGNF